LGKIAFELSEDPEYYLDIKAKCCKNNKFDYLQIAELLELDFNDNLQANLNKKLK